MLTMIQSSSVAKPFVRHEVLRRSSLYIANGLLRGGELSEKYSCVLELLEFNRSKGEDDGGC